MHWSVAALTVWIVEKKFQAMQALMRIAVFLFAENKNPVAHFSLAGSCCIL
jgi:hypothetical protein